MVPKVVTDFRLREAASAGEARSDKVMLKSITTSHLRREYLYERQ